MANIDRGSKTLNFWKFTLFWLFCLPPRGGQTPLPTSMSEGPWSDWPLWIRHC